MVGERCAAKDIRMFIAADVSHVKTPELGGVANTTEALNPRFGTVRQVRSPVSAATSAARGRRPLAA
jgi:methylaspartate ammonia-lyase